ncbi:MAG: winged helix-turn-helix transcriptional regulator [Planctomycetes bacterium]|nr:winged helix-turn-helix transcriptional regulator [Planctomycetota bacterium]
MKELSDEMVARIAERFRGLADVTRIRILVRLQGGECNVSTLATELDVAQASISKHLAVLRSLGFIQMRREGVQAFCTIRDPALPQLCQLMCDGVTRHAQELHAALGLSRKPRKT